MAAMADMITGVMNIEDVVMTATAMSIAGAIMGLNGYRERFYAPPPVIYAPPPSPGIGIFIRLKVLLRVGSSSPTRSSTQFFISFCGFASSGERAIGVDPGYK